MLQFSSQDKPDSVVMILAGEYDIACREALRVELELSLIHI